MLSCLQVNVVEQRLNGSLNIENLHGQDIISRGSHSHRPVEPFATNQAIKECNQAIKVNFHESKILILVTDGLIGVMKVPTPCHLNTIDGQWLF